MKRFLILTLLCVSTLFSMAQNCITVTSSQFENPSGDSTHWRLVINYVANGTKNLRTKVLVGTDTVLNQCFQTSGANSSGQIVYNNIITNGGAASLRAIYIRRTGTCDNGTPCADNQVLDTTVLDIKISNLYARNIGNNTEIYFKIQSVDETSRIVFNFYLPNGIKEEREVKLPTAKPGETWKVTFNNITKTYTAKRLN